MAHTSVLLNEVIDYLDPQPGQNFVDATLGGAGHALAILERTAPTGKLLAIDANEEAISAAKNLISGKEQENRIVFVHSNFSELWDIVSKYEFGPVRGILADLGFSSLELEESGKGFSFLKDEVLDMRFGKDGITAAETINQWAEEELEKIFKDFGEEKFSRRIAEKIIESRKAKPIVTTFQLVDVIKQATPGWYHHQHIHSATRTFQALRIAVNNELENLAKFLPQALEILDKGGKMAIISFHSLEDRIVKNFFREKKQQSLINILTKKAVAPGFEETSNNPRSRSAKLRVAQKI